MPAAQRHAAAARRVPQVDSWAFFNFQICGEASRCAILMAAQGCGKMERTAARLAVIRDRSCQSRSFREFPPDCVAPRADGPP